MCSSNLSKSLSKQSLPWFKFGLCTMEVLTTALVGQWSLLNLLYSITLATLQLDIIFGRKTTIEQNQTELYWVLSRAGDNSAEGLHSRSEQSPWSRRCTKSPNAKKNKTPNCINVDVLGQFPYLMVFFQAEILALLIKAACSLLEIQFRFL